MSIVAFSFRRLEPSHFQFGIHSRIFISTSRAIAFSVRCLEPHFSFGIWELFFIPIHAFWVTIFLSFGIQSHCTYSFRHLKSPSFLVFDVQSHFSSAVSFRVIAPGIRNHWHCTSYLHGFALVPIFLTSLPCAYCLFIIAIPDFPFHYTWHSPLSSRHIFKSCCWALYT